MEDMQEKRQFSGYVLKTGANGIPRGVGSRHETERNPVCLQDFWYEKPKRWSCPNNPAMIMYAFGVYIVQGIARQEREKVNWL